jgi:hypothetical protein
VMRRVREAGAGRILPRSSPAIGVGHEGRR